MSADHGSGGGAGGLSQLPGVPAGTCTPSQLHGIIDRHAMNAHCCSGVSGPGPAQGGVPAVPHTGSAVAGGDEANVATTIVGAMAAVTVVTKRRVRYMATSNL
ncbi:hypothetical protein QRB36_21635 [Mycobacterium marseillense]|nr:hypothetical protein [Mycobacterium marseillense]MDM3976772.1 hypothetical protein [Mycobacterium marseillense]